MNVWSITSGYMYSRPLTIANGPGGLSTTWDWPIRRSVGSWAFHALRARRIAMGTTLPILVAGSDMIQGSGLILDWTGMPGPVPVLEQRFEERVGVLVRQFIYAGTLGVAGSGARDALFDGVGVGQALLGRFMWPITRRLMVAGMNARPALLPELEQKITAELDWFKHQLAGREHLVCDRFGRADLTAASLLAPLARPSACPLYRKSQTPERLEKILARWRARQSLQWVEKIYANYRHSAIARPTSPSWRIHIQPYPRPVYRARDYRNHAQYCRDHAALLSSAPEKAVWLRIAEEWEKLAENADGKQGPQFAEQPGAITRKGLCSRKRRITMRRTGLAVPGALLEYRGPDRSD